MRRAAARLGALTGLEKPPLRRRHPRRIGLVCVIDLEQDANLIMAVAEAARSHGGFETLIIMTNWLDRVAPAAVARVSSAGFPLARCLRQALPTLRLGAWDALLSASESTNPSHRFVHGLTKRANADGLATFTMQHGLENIGLTYRGDGDFRFSSQRIFTWGDPAALPDWLDEHVRNQCIGVGRAQLAAREVKPLPLPIDGRPLVAVFENLHWSRYDDAYRRQFMGDMAAVSASRPDLFFLVRPHPAGRYLAKQKTAQTPANILIADPSDPAWAPISANDVLARASAAITTPSTVALDAALMDVPIAVAAYGLDLGAYDPLASLSSEEHWQRFLDSALGGGGREPLAKFRAARALEGDACALMLEVIAARASATRAARAPTLRERAAAKLTRIVRALPPPLSSLAPEPSETPSRAMYRRWIQAYDTLRGADRKTVCALCEKWGDALQVNVIIDARLATDADVAITQRSIQRQWMSKYEIQVWNDSKNLEAALNTVAAPLSAIVAAGDTLAPHALYVLAMMCRATPNALFAYSDEDCVDERGRHSPHFKPDWSPELFRAQDYACRIAVFDTAAARACAEARSVYDLLTRMHTVAPERPILHAPFVLYHARQSRLSVAPQRPGRNRPQPLVSLIVPTRDGLALLKRCVDGLRNETDYPDLEIIVVDNGSEQAETLAYLEAVQVDPRVRVLRDDAPFNFSRLNNVAVREAKGALLGLVNNDIAVIEPGWLAELVELAQIEDVGAVGAMLLYPDHTIQHAGVALGIGGVAGHVYKGQSANTLGHGARLAVRHEVSAVTAACLVTARAAWDAVGGFDEDLPVSYNDIDYCLRLRAAGRRILWTPFARLEHHESATRGRDQIGARRARLERDKGFMRARWGKRLHADPYYNPNLTLVGLDAGLAFPPRVQQPWREA